MTGQLQIASLGFISLLMKAVSAEPATVQAVPGFFPAFAASFLLILGSEIGDKTFFIAAILSMKHSHLVVFSGAIVALALMTILSAGLGVLLPNLLSKELTHYACIALFTFFGVRLLYDVVTSDGSESENEELKEVELELAHKDHDLEGSHPGDSSPARRMNTSKLPASIGGWFSSNENGKVFFQAFVMTFLAEWGDRSQIATIALASAKDAVGVTIGGILGHSICTGGAVIGGKLLASRISERQVNMAGGALFLFFALVSLVMGHD
jgi:putative Ca2+/H+ antiporter (TMEM165/GDT1 family)